MPKSGQPWDVDFLYGHPLFAAFEPIARVLRGSAFPSCEQLSAMAETQRASRAPEVAPLRFVPAAKKPRRAKRTHLALEDLYDGSIHLRREVPCLTQSYHDLFNAIAFSAFVRSKRILHERQFEALQGWVGNDPKLPGRRTREQDALTIFDEGGVVVLLDRAVMASWRSRTDHLPLCPCSPQSGALPLLFGHALVEHLYEGHTQIRASAVVIEVDGPLSAPAPVSGTQPHAHRLSRLVDVADRGLADRLLDRAQFAEPGADGIFIMDPDGRLSLGPPKPSWTAWNPGDRETFISRYIPTLS